LNAEIISTALEDPIPAGPLDEELEAEARYITVPSLLHGQRLDKCLAELIPEFSRSYLQQRLQQGDVFAGGRMLVKASSKVLAGQQIRVQLRPTPQAKSFRPETVAFDVAFEDEHVLVVNKPAGLVVHPAAGNWSGTLLNGLLMHHAAAADLPRAGIVHRLDKDTSGLMVVAKTRQALDVLGRQIAERVVQRFYLALAERTWRRGSSIQTVDQPIGRDPYHRLRMAVHGVGSHGAKTAITWVKAMDIGQNVSLLGCKLFSGRTHQIRVHLAWLGHPIVGDTVYGGHITRQIQRQALHATRLEFQHPLTGAWLGFDADLPTDIRNALEQEGLHYNYGSLGPLSFGLYMR